MGNVAKIISLGINICFFKARNYYKSIIRVLKDLHRSFIRVALEFFNNVIK